MRRSFLFGLVLTIGMLVLATTSSVAQTKNPQVMLHRGSFDIHQVPITAPQFGSDAGTTEYVILQFTGPITTADRKALEQTGVTILEYLPDYAYLIHGRAAQQVAATRLPHVYGATPFTSADKLAPAILHALQAGQSLMGPFRIVGWPDDTGALQRDLQHVRLTTQQRYTTALLAQVAQLPSVRWIEPRSRPKLLNDQARTIMHVDAAWQSQQLYGTGQVVAITDSGLDTGDPATLSPDFAGRIVATHVLSAGGDLADLNGHGTHVAGSVAGAGVQSGAIPALHQYNGSFAGVAPEASLVIEAFEADANGNISGLSDDYYPLFAQAYADGARIHTNSWGDVTGPITDTQAAYGGYPYGSQRTDQFMWEHPDLTILFAAGNSGVDGIPGDLGFCTGGDGVVDSDSLLAPGTAKNVITVGASENNRPTGGFGTVPWILLSFCFGSQPIATDTIANNANGMAAFSSRGPTDDGRSKPDIVAPGTNIVSARSHAPNAGTEWGVHETNSNYVYSGGTSMATPLTAGVSTLIRQWLVGQGMSNPSAALVKATLLNTTADIAPGQYGTGLTQEIPTARPNSVAGWGRADLGFTAAPAPYRLWTDDHTVGMATGDDVVYNDTLARPLIVRDSSQPLRVMLAWTDPPASLSAARQLVNDLDLEVIGPGGTTYHGNNVSAGDRTNNVEGIVINNPPLGTYSVRVHGFNVPIAAQPYALAVGGALQPPAQLTLSKTAKPSTTVTAGSLLTYTLALSAGNQAITQSITLSDTLAAQLSFVSASDGGQPVSIGSPIIRWTIPNLAANTTISRTLVVRVQPGTAAGTTITNRDYLATTGGNESAAGPPVNVVVAGPPATASPTIPLPTNTTTPRPATPTASATSSGPLATATRTATSTMAPATATRTPTGSPQPGTTATAPSTATATATSTSVATTTRTPSSGPQRHIILLPVVRH